VATTSAAQTNSRGASGGASGTTTDRASTAPRTRSTTATPCWREQFQRDAAAHYEVTDPERFWDVLAAADGRLVANLAPMYMGATPWIRVVDGALQALKSTRSARTEGDRNVLKFGVEQADVDREWFDEAFARAGDAEPPLRVLLKPAEETPFDEYEIVDDAQQRLPDGETA